MQYNRKAFNIKFDLDDLLGFESAGDICEGDRGKDEIICILDFK